MNLANPADFCHTFRANFNRVAINLINRFDSIHVASMCKAVLDVE
jgi:hypothetical protein